MDCAQVWPRVVQRPVLDGECEPVSAVHFLCIVVFSEMMHVIVTGAYFFFTFNFVACCIFEQSFVYVVHGDRDVPLSCSY